MSLSYNQSRLDTIEPEKLEIVCSHSRLDGINARQFKSEIIGAIANKPISLTINLQNVNFMDSAGLGCLLSILRIIRANNGKLIICAPSEQVKVLFDLTSVNELFNCQG